MNKVDSHIVARNQACVNEDCGSSDAMQVYSDGHGFCFSCESYFKPSELSEEDSNIIDFTTRSNNAPSNFQRINAIVPAEGRDRGFRERHITKQVTAFFGVKSIEQSPGGKILEHWYPYYNEEGEVACYKVRKLPKDFRSEPSGVTPPELFGQRLFPAKGKRIIITEGELDALAVAQASYDEYGRFYPVVSLPAGAGSAKKALSTHIKYLRSFDEVVICFDQDEQGQKATDVACKVIGADKVKIANLPEKDACDVLVNHGYKTLMRAIWDAEEWQPASIVSVEELWESLESYSEVESISYPPCLQGLNDKSKGMRRGEITLFTSGTGSGKSTMMREIMFHLLNSTEDSKIGIVSLEESPAETARRLAGLAINKNPAKDEIPLEELKVGFDRVFGSGRVVILNHEDCQLGSEILDNLEWMALSGCTHLFLDHITLLTSEGFDGLQGNEAQDKAMNTLSRMVKRRNVWLGLVSHLRKMGESGKSFEDGVLASLDDIRGSGSIKQISYDIFAFARNLNAESSDTRNTIKLAVLKCRYTGLTGPAGKAVYDYHTGRLNYSGAKDSLSVVETEEDELIVDI